MEAAPIVARQGGARAQPRFVTTVNIADYVPMEQEYQEPEEDYLNNADAQALVDFQNAGLMAQELVIERTGQDLRRPRAPSQGSAPRNRNGVLRDRGDRALENADEEHPGLPDDQLTSQSQAASYYAGDQAQGVLEFHVDERDGSFQEAGSQNGFMSQQASPEAAEEEEKQPELTPGGSNILMSGQTNRRARDRSQASRAQRARMSQVLERIDGYEDAEAS